MVVMVVVLFRLGSSFALDDDNFAHPPRFRYWDESRSLRVKIRCGARQNAPAGGRRLRRTLPPIPEEGGDEFRSPFGAAQAPGRTMPQVTGSTWDSGRGVGTASLRRPSGSPSRERAAHSPEGFA